MERRADANGNAVVGGNVVLMPMPAAPGDGTPGSLEVTLNAGQTLVLPLWNVLGTSYDDGTPNDPWLDMSVFHTLDLTLKIDNVTVVDGGNLMEYYSQSSLDPVIPLPAAWSPYLGIVWFQGKGLVWCTRR
jgi:hypothetical protein